MLEIGFIILGQIMIVPRMNVRSWLGGAKPNQICLMSDKEATHSFMSLELIRKLGLAGAGSGQAINMRFGKDEPHDINELALHVTL